MNIHQNNSYQWLNHSKGFIQCKVCNNRIKSGDDYIIDSISENVYCDLPCFRDMVEYKLAYSL